MNGLFRYACIRAIGITTTSPRPSPGGEGVDSPAAKRHPLSEGEAFRTHEMIYRTDKTNKTNNKTL